MGILQEDAEEVCHFWFDGICELEECVECRLEVGIMFDHLSGDAVPQEILILKEDVCKEAPDLAECEVGVDTWWPTIAKIIWNHEAARIVCEELTCLWPMSRIQVRF